MTVNPATTSITISHTAPGGQIALGGTITYTAAVVVTPPGAGTAGTVSFTDNGIPVSAGCTNVTVVAGAANCTATYNGTAPLTGGTHSVVATFTSSTPANITGSNNSAGPTQITVNKATADFSGGATTPASPVVYNTPTNLSFNINPAAGAPAPTGTYSVFDNNGATLLGTQPVAGVAQTFALPNSVIQSARNHTLTVTYSGDANYATPAGAVVTINLSVTKATPTCHHHVPAVECHLRRSSEYPGHDQWHRWNRSGSDRHCGLHQRRDQPGYGHPGQRFRHPELHGNPACPRRQHDHRGL